MTLKIFLLASARHFNKSILISIDVARARQCIAFCQMLLVMLTYQGTNFILIHFDKYVYGIQFLIKNQTFFDFRFVFSILFIIQVTRGMQ